MTQSTLTHSCSLGSVSHSAHTHMLRSLGGGRPAGASGAAVHVDAAAFEGPVLRGEVVPFRDVRHLTGGGGGQLRLQRLRLRPLWRWWKLMRRWRRRRRRHRWWRWRRRRRRRWWWWWRRRRQRQKKGRPAGGDLETGSTDRVLKLVVEKPCGRRAARSLRRGVLLPKSGGSVRHGLGLVTPPGLETAQ